MSHSDGQYSLSAFVQFFNTHFIVIVVLLVLFGGGFFVGSLWTESKLLKSGLAPTQADVQPPQPTTGTASVDDDPVLGD